MQKTRVERLKIKGLLADRYIKLSGIEIMMLMTWGECAGIMSPMGKFESEVMEKLKKSIK